VKYARVVRTDLDEFQRARDADQGKVTGPDGRAYSRRSTRTKRSVCDEIVAAGSPVVLEMYSRGQFEWFDGDDATTTWAEVRPYVVSTAPATKQLAKHNMWTAGIWESDDGSTVLYLTGYC
jgi:hypothetical protein